jgi:hypothetical protein
MSSSLLHNHQRMLTIALLPVALWSCKKQNIAESNLNKTITANVSANILYHENADGATLFGTYVTKQTSTTYGITASTTQFYNGTKAARFELRDTDPEVQNGTRAEITFPEATNLNRWYAYAIYFPGGNQYEPEASDEVITQWHQGGGFTPSLCLRTKNDTIYLRVVNSPGGSNQWFNVAPLDRGNWHTYVMHVRHSSGVDGKVEIWRDGNPNPVRTYDGINMYPLSTTVHEPNWKLGVYKSAWNGSATTTKNLRVLYFDDIMLGDENATLSEMWPVPVTTVTSFTLVDANTEQDVVTINDGQTISLSGVGLTKEKCNIRANTDPEFQGSVQFELSGQQTDMTIDNNAPYALWGDDGLGNYYYGTWNPPALGTYTLTATPYASDNATGTVGISKTITFTIVN